MKYVIIACIENYRILWMIVLISADFVIDIFFLNFIAAKWFASKNCLLNVLLNNCLQVLIGPMFLVVKIADWYQLKWIPFIVVFWRQQFATSIVQSFWIRIPRQIFLPPLIIHIITLESHGSVSIKNVCLSFAVKNILIGKKPSNFTDHVNWMKLKQFEFECFFWVLYAN